MKNIKECPICGSKGILKTTYDTEWVECEKCGTKTKTEVGDYYDEGFMDGSYVIPLWNKGKILIHNSKNLGRKEEAN